MNRTAHSVVKVGLQEATSLEVPGTPIYVEMECLWYRIGPAAIPRRTTKSRGP
jgi:hypothetical protein